MLTPDARVWSALQVLTGAELEVLRKISAELPNVEAIAPAETVVQMKEHRVRRTQRQLLPGYVLLQWQREPHVYYRIKGFHGVIRFLGGGTPDVIPDEQMHVWIAIARHCETGQPAPAVREAGMTRIIGGPLAGAPVSGFNARAGRARLEVQLADQRHTVTVAVAVAEAPFGKGIAIHIPTTPDINGDGNTTC